MYARIQDMLSKALSENIFPCYAAAIGKGDDIYYRSFGGYRSLTPEKQTLTEDTLFDMASLSKLIGTTMAALKLIEQHKLSFDNTLSDYFVECYGKEKTTIRQLMTHTSGIKAHFPLWLRGITPDRAFDAILREEYGYEPDGNAVYSCMGYILLGRILEIIEKEPLDSIVSRLVLSQLNMTDSCYCPKNRICASTETDPFTGEPICGVVHDENARFLGGIAGNAGLFCTLNDTIKFAEMLSKSGKGYINESLFEYAVTDHTPNSSDRRGIGFQLIGNRYGHTGFTGTSVFVDRTSGIYAVLLTNRIHPSRNNHALISFRREFHKVIFGDQI